MNVLETVVENGFCCNCGMCAAVCPGGRIQIAETEYGECQPRARAPCKESCHLCLEVCPFSNVHGRNEDDLGKQRFGSDPACAHHVSMGWVRDTFVGSVADESERLKAASGGLATAVLCELLKNGQVDAALVLEPLEQRPWYRFRIAETEEQVLASRGSAYHVVACDKVIADVLAGPERSYAMMALPCVVKGLRLAQERLPALRRRIRYVLGLTCSSHRSLLFADALTALMGGSQGRLRYRSKRNARKALDFRAELKTDRNVRTVKMLGLFGLLWVNEVGILQSCLYCDDVFAELADATFMDAWLPEYEADQRGTSLVISRHEGLSTVLTTLLDTGKCEGGPIAPDKIEQSQRGVLHRRRGLLAARCRVAEETLGYVPKKRLEICPAYCRETDHTQARRELAFFHDVRNELLRFRKRLSRKPRWLARWRAWRLCWRVLLAARRHGALGRTFHATKHLSSKPK